jgi:hypothetical protein
MKPIQWVVALVVLVAMVFVITFAMNFLGDSKQNTPPPPDDGGGSATVLKFLTTSYPAQKENTPIVKYVDMEIKNDGERNPGYRDYLFVNPTDEEVKLGRTGKVCTCSGVELYLAPEEWKTQAALLLAAEAAGGAFQASEGVGGSPHPLFGLGSLALYDRKLRDIAADEEKLKPAAGLNVGADHLPETAAIPPRAVGWLRMKWKAEKAEDKLVNAELTAHSTKGNGLIKLEARVRFVEPVQYPAKDVPVDELTLDRVERKPGDKPQTIKTVYLVLWSTTRKSLAPKAEVMAKVKPEQNPVQIDATDVYSPAALEHAPPVKPGQPPPEPGHVQCAYRIPVRLLDRSPDGSRPMPFGNLKVRVRVTFDDEDIEPVVFVIGGRLRGDIRVGGGDEGRLDFGTFRAQDGSAEQTVTLYSDVAGLELEVDTERTPAFLRDAVTRIDPPKKTLTGETAWTVHARIGPNKAVGGFPSLDSEDYWDSAVYIKVKGDNSRSLRILVSGSANR